MLKQLLTNFILRYKVICLSKELPSFHKKNVYFWQFYSFWPLNLKMKFETCIFKQYKIIHPVILF